MSRRIEALTMTGPIAGKLGGARGVLDAVLCVVSNVQGFRFNEYFVFV